MKCGSITIRDLCFKFENGQINLNPPYQRRAAWKTKQRKLLLSSIFNGIPIPALIFYKRFDNYKNIDILDVLDGKQRIETILHFVGLLKIPGEKVLCAELIHPDSNEKDLISFKDLDKGKLEQKYPELKKKFWTYELPTIVYDEESLNVFGNSVSPTDIFVRINSTGSVLKPNEIRHAKSESSNKFFTLGVNLEKKYKQLFVNNWKIFSEQDASRYQLHEYILELCTAIHFENYTDKKKKLDELTYQYKWTGKEIEELRKTFDKVIGWIKNIFQDKPIRHTRFRNKSDFYSLFVVLLNFLNKGYVINDKEVNKKFSRKLTEFSHNIQKLSPKIKPYGSPKLSREEQEYYKYIVATRQSTDKKSNREIRHNYIYSLLSEIDVPIKDNRRNFSKDYKDFLWNKLTENNKKPKCPICGKILDYDDAQVDHKYPHSEGGPTELENAQLVCSRCNKSKGDKIL